jgi:hypothetical protein
MVRGQQQQPLVGLVAMEREERGKPDFNTPYTLQC